ncbi:hypothetical protein [Puniceicoccus vermicola]|uniref:PEP-CTERM sorting domain-containing protein n=1 Tax=Puniceicoccus vermicola TaxID=388746 RepID=A0A7X1AY96_9BACT|nr:hypothetical protein [Puniceicoccus vermicola]MBC2602213.1 hypothetical protein [Puniceicoccus vermicola]
MKISINLLLSTLGIAPTLLCAQSILIDFGDENKQTTGQPETWNNAHLGIVAGGNTGRLFSDMVDTEGEPTGISLDITNAFDGRNINGFGSSNFNTGGPTPYPTTATEDSFYTATAEAGITPSDGLGILEFSGLDPAKTYTFTMYASRKATDNRETQYDFVGENSNSVYLNAGDNIAGTVTTIGIRSTASGTISLTVQKGSNNESEYSYLGAVQINAIPEPASAAFLFSVLSASFVILRRRR